MPSFVLRDEDGAASRLEGERRGRVMVVVRQRTGEPRTARAGRARSFDEDGQALIEFAVALPILLLLLTSILIFGLVLNNYVMLTNATDSGARLLSISRGQTTDPCATTAAAVYAAAPVLRQSSYTFTITLNGTKYTGTSCSGSGAVANMVQGAQAQVVVSYPCSLAMYGMNAGPSCTLQAQTTALIQ